MARWPTSARWSTPRCSSTSTAPPPWRRRCSPPGPRSCRLVTEYLFAPEAIDDPDFDPTPVIEFNELVTHQDNEACERVQVGVTSRAFDHGVFPAKDSWVHGFDQRYLRDVEGD